MKAWVGILGFLLGLAGAASAQPATVQFLGEPRPKGNPARIVSLAPNLTEILYALGAGNRVVGVTRYDDYPSQVQALPKVGGFVDPSLEGILALKPDLVVCVPNSGGRDRMDTLVRMGVSVLVLPAYGLDDVFLDIEALGQVTDYMQPAAAMISRLRAEIAKTIERVKDLPRVRALLVYGHKPIVAAGKGSFGDAMLVLAGENVAGGLTVPYPTLPMEEIIRLAPEVIIDASASGSGAELGPKEVQEVWGKWEVLPAVKHHRTHVFNSSVWFRAGPRIGEGLLKLSKILHPNP